MAFSSPESFSRSVTAPSSAATLAAARFFARSVSFAATALRSLVNGAWPAVEVNLHDVGDVAGGQPALLRAVGLHEQGERLGDTDRIRQLHQGTLAKAALHHRLRHLPAHVGRPM